MTNWITDTPYARIKLKGLTSAHGRTKTTEKNES